MKKILIFWFIFCVLPFMACAEETVESHSHLFQTTYPNGTSEEGSVNVAISKDWIRFKMAPDKVDEQNASLIAPEKQSDMQLFLERQEMMYVNHQDKTYSVLSKEQMEAFKQRSQKMMEALQGQAGSIRDPEKTNMMEGLMNSIREQQRIQLEKALENPDLSPEKRTRLEKALKNQTPMGQKGNLFGISMKLKINKTGKTGRQNGVSCEWYTLEMFDVRHICAASWSDIPGGMRTKQLYHAWFDYMKDFAKGLPFGDSLLDQTKEIDGFPVITITKNQDENTTFSEQRYQETKKRRVAFGPPEGYVLESHELGGPKRTHRRVLGTKPRQGKEAMGTSAVGKSVASEQVDKACKKIDGKIICAGNADSVTPEGQLSTPGVDLGNLPPETQKALEMFKGLFGNQ